MSGSTGADRVKSREDYKIFLRDYKALISRYPSFFDLWPSGSYNSDLSKTSFGDIDLITSLNTNDPKGVAKKNLAKWLEYQDCVIPFSSEKYLGKRSLNTGEIVTVRFYSDELGYSAQVDNIIALSSTEAEFKSRFLDMPAEKQGLVLGLVKIATIETDPSILFDRLGIMPKEVLREFQEWEFNLSSSELQLRLVEYIPHTFKEKSRTIIWRSTDFSQVEKLLEGYDLFSSFDELLSACYDTINSNRSPNRICGVFTSMVSIKSGEVGTAKALKKQESIDKILSTFRK